MRLFKLWGNVVLPTQTSEGILYESHSPLSMRSFKKYTTLLTFPAYFIATSPVLSWSNSSKKPSPPFLLNVTLDVWQKLIKVLNIFFSSIIDEWILWNFVGRIHLLLLLPKLYKANSRYLNAQNVSNRKLSSVSEPNASQYWLIVQLFLPKFLFIQVIIHK